MNAYVIFDVRSDKCHIFSHLKLYYRVRDWNQTEKKRLIEFKNYNNNGDFNISDNRNRNLNIIIPH